MYFVFLFPASIFKKFFVLRGELGLYSVKHAFGEEIINVKGEFLVKCARISSAIRLKIKTKCDLN